METGEEVKVERIAIHVYGVAMLIVVVVFMTIIMNSWLSVDQTAISTCNQNN